jgi:excisionase family DNA binding protein
MLYPALGFMSSPNFVTVNGMQNELKTAPPERRVVTLYEAAAILRISRGAAYAAAQRREIPTIRIGRRLLVPAAALERMLAGGAAA